MNWIKDLISIPKPKYPKLIHIYLFSALSTLFISYSVFYHKLSSHWLLLALSLWFLSLFAPSTLKRFLYTVSYLVFLFIHIISLTLLALTFYAVILLTSLLFRAIGKDPMQRQWTSDSTYLQKSESLSKDLFTRPY